MYRKYRKIKDHYHYTGKYRGATHNICNSRYEIPKEISIAFRNCSRYDYHFIIKELDKTLEGQFECFGEILKNVLLFLYQLKNSLIMVTHDLKFIDSLRFSFGFRLIDFIMINAKILNLALATCQSKMIN